MIAKKNTHSVDTIEIIVKINWFDWEDCSEITYNF